MGHQMLNDSQLLRAVRDELRFDPSFTDDDIKVDVAAGAVSLSGFVPSYAEKRLAINAAQRIGGVQKVTDDIIVRIPSSVRATDRDIASCASQSLAWDTSVAQQTKATVDKGVVTLSGTARNQFQKHAAELNVSRLYGVTGVVNRVTLQPDTPTLAGFPAEITRALGRFALDGADMKVTAEGGKVFLNGTVANAHQREIAEHAAWSAPGVTEVDERLTIN
jgi:osmotically-inducible protein OsmY